MLGDPTSLYGGRERQVLLLRGPVGGRGAGFPILAKPRRQAEMSQLSLDPCQCYGGPTIRTNVIATANHDVLG